MFFFKQKTEYEVRISDWSSDVCSADLQRLVEGAMRFGEQIVGRRRSVQRLQSPFHAMASRQQIRFPFDIAAFHRRTQTQGINRGAGLRHFDEILDDRTSVV